MWHLNVQCVHCQQSGGGKLHEVRYCVRLLWKSTSVGQQNASDRRLEINGGLWTWPSWNTQINLPRTSLKRLPLAKYLHISGTCNSDVSLWNWSNCWSQWPSEYCRLWSQCPLIWIWISWKFILYRTSVSNKWVLSLKIWFLLSIHISQKLTRQSSHLY